MVNNIFKNTKVNKKSNIISNNDRTLQSINEIQEHARQSSTWKNKRKEASMDEHPNQHNAIRRQGFIIIQ